MEYIFLSGNGFTFYGDIRFEKGFKLEKIQFQGGTCVTCEAVRESVGGKACKGNRTQQVLDWSRFGWLCWWLNVLAVIGIAVSTHLQNYNPNSLHFSVFSGGLL